MESRRLDRLELLKRVEKLESSEQSDNDKDLVQGNLKFNKNKTTPCKDVENEQQQFSVLGFHESSGNISQNASRLEHQNS